MSHDGKRRNDLLDKSNLERAIHPFATDNLKIDRRPVKGPIVIDQTAIEFRNLSQSVTFPVLMNNTRAIRLKLW